MSDIIKSSIFATNIQRYDVISILAGLPIPLDHLFLHNDDLWILVYSDVLRIHRTTLVNRRCSGIFWEDQQELRSGTSKIQKALWAGGCRCDLPKTCRWKTNKPRLSPLIRQFSFRERLHSKRNNIYLNPFFLRVDFFVLIQLYLESQVLILASFFLILNSVSLHFKNLICPSH